jgi:hypothetical protein
VFFQPNQNSQLADVLRSRRLDQLIDLKAREFDKTEHRLVGIEQRGGVCLPRLELLDFYVSVHLVVLIAVQEFRKVRIDMGEATSAFLLFTGSMIRNDGLSL